MWLCDDLDVDVDDVNDLDVGLDVDDVDDVDVAVVVDLDVDVDRDPDPEVRDFLPFSSHSTHKLITKILQHTKTYAFYQSDKKIEIILIHSY